MWNIHFQCLCLKTNRKIYSPGAITVASVATSKQRSQLKHIKRSTFVKNHVAWKPIGNIYSLGTSFVLIWQLSSLGVKRYWAGITWSTDQPTERQMEKKMLPCFKGGIKQIVIKIFLNLNQPNTYLFLFVQLGWMTW